MRLAIARANELRVPLIVAGDLHDTKANLRGECINAMIETFRPLRKNAYILRGNHDSLNERSEETALACLARDSYGEDDEQGAIILINKRADFTNEIACKRNSLWFIPYQHDISKLRAELKKVEKDAVVIMHQGLTSSKSGEYIQDKSALNPEDVAGFRIISGHYHTRQTIALPDGGQWDYIGNPYSLNYGEADDPPKGFQVLMRDGSLEFVPTNLRKHVVYECEASPLSIAACPKIRPNDLLWIKVKGTRTDLAKVDKKYVDGYAGLFGEFPFKLDLIPNDSPIQPDITHLNLSGAPLLDSIIEDLPGDQNKLKDVWRRLCE